MSLSLPKIAWRNLQRRPLRTAFTSGGIAVGIAAIIAISGISRGLAKTWAEAFEARGADIVVNIQGGGLLPGVFDDAMQGELAKVPGVSGASATLWQTLSVEDVSSMVVSGRDWGGIGWSNLKIKEGRMPNDGAEKAVILGTTAAELLKKKVGDKVQLELEEFLVCGMFDGGALAENGSVVLSLPLLQDITSNEGKINFVNLRVEKHGDEAAVKQLCEEIHKRFPKMRAMPASETLSSTRGYQMMQAGSAATSMLALFVGAIGVMNTMLMSIFERTAEIGVLSAIGWRRGRIVATILLEGVALSLIGFVAGTVLGLLALKILGASAMLKGHLHPYVGPDLLLLAFVVSIFVGFFSGLYPAWKGARTSPMVALRSI